MTLRRLLLLVLAVVALAAPPPRDAVARPDKPPKKARKGDEDHPTRTTTTTTRTTTTRTTTTRTTTTRTTSTTRTTTTDRPRTRPTRTTTTARTTTTVRTTTTRRPVTSTFPPTSSTTALPTTTTTLPAPSLCTGGALITRGVLRLRTVTLRDTAGVMILTGRLPLLEVEGPIDPATTGMQFEVVPVDPTIDRPPLAAFTAATGPVPPGERGDGCDPGDGWKGTVYRNRSGHLDAPTCDASARGLLVVRIRDRRARGLGVWFRAEIQRVGLPPPGVPLLATVVLGGPDAGRAGLCGDRLFDPLSCVRRPSGLVCR